MSVINLLNDRFVSLAITNDDYNQGGHAPAVERMERDRITDEARARLNNSDVSARDVAAYVLTPDGHFHSRLRLPAVEETQRFHAWLKKTLEELGTKSSSPLPAKTSARRRIAAPDALILRLTTRYRFGLDDIETPKVDWRQATMDKRFRAMTAAPTDDLLVLEKHELGLLLGPMDARAGASWDCGKDVAEKLLRDIRPSTTNKDNVRRQIELAKLHGTLLNTNDGVGTIRLQGELRMRQPVLRFGDDADNVDVSIVGYVDFDPRSRRILSVSMATNWAKYIGGDFGAAIWSE